MRGVNKLVLEVKSENEYFEKALIFLKPGYCDKPQHEISDNAEKLLSKIKENPKNKKKKHSFLTAFLCWLSGASFMWILMLLLNQL